MLRSYLGSNRALVNRPDRRTAADKHWSGKMTLRPFSRNFPADPRFPSAVKTLSKPPSESVPKASETGHKMMINNVLLPTMWVSLYFVPYFPLSAGRAEGARRHRSQRNDPHGFRHEDVSALEREDERERITRTIEILTEMAGRRPTGWFSLPRQGDPFAGGTISPNTMDLLLDAGYTYIGNGLADDIPHYWVTDFASRRALLTLPYYYHFDDQFFLMFPRKGTGLEHPDALSRNWKAEFDAQYKRGRHFHMTLHPRHIGWCNRLQLLEDFLAYIRGFPGLWNPTGQECATYWLATIPRARTCDSSQVSGRTIPEA